MKQAMAPAIAIAIAILLAAPVTAQEGLPDFAAEFGSADVNRDGQITRDEATPLLEQAWTSLDQDGDDVISSAEQQILLEYVGGGSGPAVQDLVDRYLVLDANGDGIIAWAEIDPRFHSLITRADSDGDLAVTARELEQMLGQ